MTNDGILIIDKPPDWTSHDVVACVRKLLKTRRVGHTGTLDPFATGVLVVCVNRATRLAQFLSGDDKEYVATMRLGWATDTGDLTGAVRGAVSDARQITAEQVRAALAPLRGRIQQIPPMYSAKKVGGVKLYEMARRGEEIARAPVEIEIKELELIEEIVGGDEVSTKDFVIRVVCSAGTYVRTLAEDIGRQLGLGAHLTALRRTRAGHCALERAITLDQLAALSETAQIEQALIAPVDALALPELRLNDDECKAVRHGRSLRRDEVWPDRTRAQACDANRQLVAIAEFDATKKLWQPRVVWGET
jgi:tRNA pseudouridine55 synthase